MWLIKKELMVAFDHETYVRVINRLKEANIKFRVRVTYPHPGGVPANKNMAAMGTTHNDFLDKFTNTYCIFVRPKDYDEAVYAINKVE